ncbi:expressed unknown protein [Seminavis robusta]|uniref:Uncharacterized protein n=1 Tax=Seminavis robusta TaxID=568900 RepID=A0A9N8HJG6_9STRA|nr:expressed unknown protein [Seminavis robusta]|eukprot:Sro661_g183100.1 n/a (189) ;mRNA; f:1618-2264
MTPPSGLSMGASACSVDEFKDDIPAPPPVRITKVEVDRRKSQAVAIQGICYAVAFLLSYSLSYVAIIRFHIRGSGNDILDYIALCILAPSAGTFNYIVFARTRVMKTPEGKFLKALFFCTCLRKNEEIKRNSQQKFRKSAPDQELQHCQPATVSNDLYIPDLDIPDLEESPQVSGVRESGSEDAGVIE